MKLKSLFACALFSAMCTNSSAAVYTLSVDVNSRIGEVPLQIDEIQAMNYPILDVNDATKAGSYCVSTGKNTVGVDGGTATEANSLCPQLTPQYSIIQFSGVPLSYLTVHYKILQQDQSGFRFHYSSGNPIDGSYSYQLNGEGILELPFNSRITLIDKAQVSDGSLTFNYEMTGIYQ